MKKSLILLFCALMIPAVVWGQATAQIHGTVQDSSGSSIPGAAVKVTQLETGVVLDGRLDQVVGAASLLPDQGIEETCGLQVGLVLRTLSSLAGGEIRGRSALCFLDYLAPVRAGGVVEAGGIGLGNQLLVTPAHHPCQHRSSDLSAQLRVRSTASGAVALLGRAA